MPTMTKPSPPKAPLPPVPPNAVRVTAADFNGRTFDGCPFSAIPNWLSLAVSNGAVRIEPSDRDYALWRVGDAVAEPGDLIVRAEDGSLSVVTVAEQRGEGR